AVLAQRGGGRFRARPERDRFHITPRSSLGHQLEHPRLQHTLMHLCVDPDLRHVYSTFASVRTWMIRSTAVPSSWMMTPALRASACVKPSIVSAASPRSMPRSPSPICLISLERAAMIPFSDAYRGSAMPAVTVTRTGIAAYQTWYT